MTTRTFLLIAGAAVALALLRLAVAPSGPAPAAASAPPPATAWTVDPDASRIAFVSTKNGETSEIHRFAEVTGEISETGAARVEIPLASVDTEIDIRDQRMREMLFEVADFPLAEIRADVDLPALEDLALNARREMPLAVTVDAHGATAEYETTVAVVRLWEDRVAVSSVEPITVEASDFGYAAGVEALREVAGLDSISTEVPVSFDLILER